MKIVTVPDWADAAWRYARAVKNGDAVAGPFVRSLCDVFLGSLSREDIYYDVAAADRAADFCKDCIRLIDGDAGRRWEPLPWQEFVVRNTFGWHKADGSRLVREVYIETAKGSGKNILGPAMVLYHSIGLGIGSPQVIFAANTAEQAGVSFGALCNLVEQWPYLSDRSRILGGSGERRKTIEIYGSVADKRAKRNLRAIFHRFSSDALGKGKSGWIPSAVLIDEYQEAESDAMVNFLKFGFKKRAGSEQGVLLVRMLNAGSNPLMPAGVEHGRALRWLGIDDPAFGAGVDDEGGLDAADRDMGYFPYVTGLDSGDNPWEDESCWVKANPSLPVTPGYAYLRDQVKSSKGAPSAEALVDRLNFSTWTDSASPFLSRDRWINLEVKDIGDVGDLPCYIGIDLSSKGDLSAASLCFNRNGHWIVESKAWIPGGGLAERVRVEGVPYKNWADRGFLEVVNGDVIDVDYVASWVKGVVERYDVRAVGMDAYRIGLFENSLRALGLGWTRDARMRGGSAFLLVNHRQGFQAPPVGEKELPVCMSVSIQVFNELVLGKSLTVKQNPVLRSSVLGATVIQDGKGNCSLTKNKAKWKIDPLVALVTGLGIGHICEGNKSRSGVVDISSARWG